MGKGSKQPIDSRLIEILEMVNLLLPEEDLSPAAFSNSADIIDNIHSMLSILTADYQTWQMNQENIDSRLTGLLDVIISIASLNFEAKAAIGEDGDIFDAIATGLNALGEELRASVISRNYLDNVYDSLQTSLVVLDVEYRIQSLNKSSAKLLQYQEEELTNLPYSLILSPDAEKQLFPGGLLMESSAAPIETTYQTKDGIQIPVSFSCSKLLNKSGEITGYVCLAADITEQKKSQDAIQKAEIRYRTLFEQSPDGITIFDPKTLSFTEFNDIAPKIAGYTREEFSKLSISDLEAQETPEDTIARMDKLAREGQTEFESKWIRKDGSVIDIFVITKSVEINNQQYYFGIVRDITKEKRIQENVLSSLQEKEVLLKEIHHRVKNNLQIISSLLFLQAKSINDDSVGEILQESRRRVQSMSLIHEKLYQSQDLGKVNFNDYVRSMTDNVYHSFGASTALGNRIIDVDDDVFLNIDLAIPCGLIINELVSNAIKHAFPDKNIGTIKIEIKKAPNLKNYILKIEDDGVGFPENFNIESSNSLGLELVKNLVNQIDGSLSIINNHGMKYKIEFEDR